MMKKGDEIVRVVSVIIPVYNIEKYIKCCIESVCQQTYKNLEIIIINDGSTDQSAQICTQMAKNDSRIILITQENAGLSAARNTGLKLATGEYCCFVDGDDWLSKDTIQIAMNEMDETVDVYMFPYIREFSDCSIKNEILNDDYIMYESSSLKQFVRKLYGPVHEELRNPYRMENLNTAWGKIYRTKCLQNIFFVDTCEIGTEDLWFNLMVFENVQKAVFSKSTWYHYFKGNEEALTQKYKATLFQGWKKLYSNMQQMIENNHKKEEFSLALQNRIVVNLFSLCLNIVCSNLPHRQKKSEMRKILEDDMYKKAFSTFEFHNLSLPWRFFYRCCLHKWYCFIFIMLFVANRLRKHVH